MNRVPQPDAPVAVVGSVNLDIVIGLDIVPEPGQTVVGNVLSEHSGGKGGNQAVAAARLVPTIILGAVGDDLAGDELVGALAKAGVDVRFVQHSQLPSGRAFITVTPDGENRIIVLPGANGALGADSVTAALDAAMPSVVLAQQEITGAAVEAAVAWAAANSKRFLLNASPIRIIDEAVLGAADPIIVNAEEARDIVGTSTETDEASLARMLLRFSRSAIVTAGSRGAYVAEGGSVKHIEAPTVRVVDTTGAGDEFAGTVAAALASGETLLEAAIRATAAAARLVQVPRGSR